MWNMILFALEIMGMWLAVILIHEIGHVATYRLLLGKQPKITLNRKWIRVHIEDALPKEKIAIALNGILAGYATLLLWMMDNLEVYGIMIFTVLYLMASRTDIEMIVKNMKVKS